MFTLAFALNFSLSSSIVLYICSRILLRLYDAINANIDIQRPTTMAPAYILSNQVIHARLLPKFSTHAFTYPTLSLLLSLDALEARHLDLSLFGGVLNVFSYGRRWGCLAGLRAANYLGSAYTISDRDKSVKVEDKRTIRQKLETILDERGRTQRMLGGVWMMTMPSYLGVESINPLTVYFGYAKGEERVWLVILEVHNTFGEQHVYVLEVGKDEDANHDSSYEHQWTFPRQFHVSPFNDRSGYYEVAVTSPSHPPPSIHGSPTTDGAAPTSLPPLPKVRVHLLTARRPQTPTNPPAEPRLKLTALTRTVKATPLTAFGLLTAFIRLPFSLLLTFPRIAYQAKILHYEKRLDVYARPEPRASNAEVEARFESMGAANPVEGVRAVERGGSLKWQGEGVLERYARSRVEGYLAIRTLQTRQGVRLQSVDPSVAPIVFNPPRALRDEDEMEELIVHYRSPRFFTILFSAPSAAHALLLGSDTEHVFTVSSRDAFLQLFSQSVYAPPPLTLDIASYIRASPVPSSIDVPVPECQPLDTILTSTSSMVLNCVVLFALSVLDWLERAVFTVTSARFVKGTEPWLAWHRAAVTFREGPEAASWERLRRDGGIGSVRRGFSSVAHKGRSKRFL